MQNVPAKYVRVARGKLLSPNSHAPPSTPSMRYAEPPTAPTGKPDEGGNQWPSSVAINGNQRVSGRSATCPERLADCYEICLNTKARLSSTKT